jgi:hypothetical protein
MLHNLWCRRRRAAITLLAAIFFRPVFASRADAKPEAEAGLTRLRTDCEDASIGGASAEASIQALRKCISALQQYSAEAHERSKRSKDANSHYAEHLKTANEMLKTLLEEQAAHNRYFQTFREDQRQEMDGLLKSLGDMQSKVAMEQASGSASDAHHSGRRATSTFALEPRGNFISQRSFLDDADSDLSTRKARATSSRHAAGDDRHHSRRAAVPIAALTQAADADDVGHFEQRGRRSRRHKSLKHDKEAEEDTDRDPEAEDQPAVKKEPCEKARGTNYDNINTHETGHMIKESETDEDAGTEDDGSSKKTLATQTFGTDIDHNHIELPLPDDDDQTSLDDQAQGELEAKEHILVKSLHHDSEVVSHASKVLQEMEKDKKNSAKALEADYLKKRQAADLAKKTLEEQTKLYNESKMVYDEIGNKTAAALDVYKKLAAEHKEYEEKYVDAWKSYHNLDKEAARALKAAQLASDVVNQKKSSLKYWNEQLDKGEAKLEEETRDLAVARKAESEAEALPGRRLKPEESSATTLPIVVVLSLCLGASAASFFLP